MVVSDGHASRSYRRSLSHISESSADGVVLAESGDVTSLVSISDISMEVASMTPEPPSPAAEVSPRRRHVVDDVTDQQDSVRTEGVDSASQPAGGDVTYVARRVLVVEEQPGADDMVDSGLEDALGAVMSSLDDYRGQFPELQLLEQELKLLQVTLKVNQLEFPVCSSHTSQSDAHVH